MRILKIKSDNFRIYRICRTLFTYQMVQDSTFTQDATPSFSVCTSSTSGMNPVFDNMQMTELNRARRVNIKKVHLDKKRASPKSWSCFI